MVWYYETGPSVEIMRSIKDLRRVLEPEATARAAARGTAEDLAAIASAYEDMVSTIGDVNTNADADLRFHTAIFAATRNMVYAQLIDLIAVAIYANRAISSHDEVAEGQKRSLPYHKDVLDAIIARDPDAALKASAPPARFLAHRSLRFLRRRGAAPKAAHWRTHLPLRPRLT